MQLPGRGMRWNEPSYKRLVPLAQAIGEAIVPHLDRPFAFFGHSMGATVSFELTRYLRRWHKIEPVHLFVSGRPGPQIPEPITYNLPDSEFIQELILLNGTPKEVLGQPEVLKLTLPVVRADFEALQTYQYTEGPPLDCPITAFGGEEDKEVGRGYLEAWRELTSSRFKLYMLPGDYFFLHSHEERLLSILSGEIGRLTKWLDTRKDVTFQSTY